MSGGPSTLAGFQLSFMKARMAFFHELCEEVEKLDARVLWKPNGYHTDFPDPYLTFVLDAKRFEVGCRKRVFTVSAEWRGFSLDVSELDTLATEDRVTFDSWPDRLLVHAWTQAKLGEYLRAILRAPTVPS